ncbi:hypothetical protein K7432_017663 [Basidiobolus ranarum]|uniref:Amino acid transporter transmembrane domain-containing protein n=1 Tax=Basidiobolus ranarum TaxID=34480 RepID=A0ABR2VK30_9FUNG
MGGPRIKKGKLINESCPATKPTVLVAISVSQIGFVCGSSIFIAENLQQVVQDISHNLLTLSTPQILFFTGIFLSPLILIRNIARLSFVAVISSVLFLTGLVALIYFDVKSLFYSSPSEGINFTPGPNITYYFNPVSYSVFIGTAVYSFEGIGLIIPIYDAMAKPQYFPHVLTAVMAVVALVFSLVGGLGYFAFGSKVQTVALLNLPNGPVVHTIRMAYTIAAALSNALTIFPAVRIIENAVFKQKTGKLNLAIKWQKNLLRVGIVVLTMFIAMFGANDLDKFISLIGSICCTPLSLIFPSLFHYRAIATTKRQKMIDISLACFGTFIMLFTVWTTASQWGTPT